MLNIPLVVGLLGTVIAPTAAIIAVVASFGFKCKIEFVKDDGSVIDLTEKAGVFYEEAKEKAPGMGYCGTSTVEELKEKGSEIYADLKEKGSDAFSKAKDVAEDVKAKMKKDDDFDIFDIVDDIDDIDDIDQFDDDIESIEDMELAEECCEDGETLEESKE